MHVKQFEGHKVHVPKAFQYLSLQIKQLDTVEHDKQLLPQFRHAKPVSKYCPS